MDYINELVGKAHDNAVAHLFWEKPPSFLEQIALMHSELSEALEDFRDGRGVNEVYYECKYPYSECPKPADFPGCVECEYGKPCGIPSELADTVIRIFDTCGHYGIDLNEAIEQKMRYNIGRPIKHNKVM